MNRNGHSPVTTAAVLLKSAVDANPAAWPEMVQGMRDPIQLIAPGARTAKEATSWLCSGCVVVQHGQTFEFPDEHYHLSLAVIGV